METLPNVARLSKRVFRVLGQNPSQFTLQGTNTYLIGRKPPYVLFDTGIGLEEYLPVLQSAIEAERPADTLATTQDISSIIVSHRHQDHINGVPGVLALLRRLWETRGSPGQYTPPNIYKFPLPPTHPDPHVEDLLSNLTPGSFIPSPTNSPAHDLTDGQILPIGTDGTTVEVMHTPGHTVDSICLILRAPDADPAIFTADTILGGSTSVFEDLTTYLQSLKRIQATITSNNVKDFILYPGHGPVVTDGADTVRIYITHRLEREAAIRKLLEKQSPSGASAWTPMDIVKVLYRTVPESIWPHAMKGVILHLRKLEDDGVVDHLGGEGPKSLWELTL